MYKAKTLHIPILALLLFFNACSSSNSSTLDISEDQLSGETVVIDIFSARGFLGGSDYERYHMKNHVLWRECGNVNVESNSAIRSREVDGDRELGTDPNLDMEQRRVEKLSPSQRLALEEIAQNLLKDMESGKKRAPAPGSVFSLAQPGLFELQVQIGEQRNRLITSVDAVSNGESSFLKNVRDFFASVRSVGPDICGTKSFFGIRKKEI